jgi:hypothetical protein
MKCVRKTPEGLRASRKRRAVRRRVVDDGEAGTFARLLGKMPNVGKDRDFQRLQDKGRNLEEFD